MWISKLCVCHLEALPLPHGGEQPAPREGGAALAGVGDEVVEGRPGARVHVAPRPVPDPEPEDEEDQDADGHEQPQHRLARQLGLHLGNTRGYISE